MGGIKGGEQAFFADMLPRGRLMGSALTSLAENELPGGLPSEPRCPWSRKLWERAGESSGKNQEFNKQNETMKNVSNIILGDLISKPLAGRKRSIRKLLFLFTASAAGLAPPSPPLPQAGCGGKKAQCGE